MSFQALLEAAEFIELRTTDEPREDEDSKDFHPYAKTPSSPNSGSDTSSTDGILFLMSPSSVEDARERRRPGGAGTREVHNKLEKNRRAHLKECFDILKQHIPHMEDKKTSNLSILRGALRYVQILKRREKENQVELDRLAKQKAVLQRKMERLKLEMSKLNLELDVSRVITLYNDCDNETASTSTAADEAEPIMSDDDGDIKPVPLIVKIPRPGVEYSPPTQNKTTSTNSLDAYSVKNEPPSIITVPLSTASARLPVPATAQVVTTAGLVTQLLSTVRTPVTKILHETLTQRQALARLQNPESQTTHATTAQSSSGMRTSPQAAKTFTQMRPQIAFTPMMTLSSSLTSTTSVAGISKLLPGTVTFPLTTLAKTFAQPFLVAAQLPVTNISANTHNPTTTTVTTTTEAIPVPVKLTNSFGHSLTTNVSSISNANLSPTFSGTIKPFLAMPAGAQIVSANQLAALNPILAQTLPRTTTAVANITNLVGSVSNLGSSVFTSETTSTVPQVRSLGYVAPVTQIVSPMTIMSPRLQQTPLSNMLNTTFLKTIPIISPQLLQTGQVIGQAGPVLGQATQVIGQQAQVIGQQAQVLTQPAQVLTQPVVKPVVVVSLPNVISTSAAPAVSISFTALSTAS